MQGLVLHTPSLAALIFLSAALPLGLYTVWSDLSRMKIPNHVTDLLFVLFVILGFFALPWEDYLWRYANFAGGLAFGFLFYATGSMGAGDSKFIAAALPYVAAADLIFTGMIFAAALLGAWVTHKLVAMSPLRRLAPDWASWHAGPKHPMGIALSATLIVYLGLCAIQ